MKTALAAVSLAVVLGAGFPVAAQDGFTSQDGFSSMSSPAPAPAAPAPIVWHDGESPHFDIRYQSDWPPSGFVFKVEDIHSKLQMTLGMLGGTIFGAKYRMVLFSDQASYVGSAFKPPAWSAGLAIPKYRVLLLYEMKDGHEFDRTMAHEMTHLLFESYFMQEQSMPPRWIDEGVAMMMEDKGAPSADGEAWWNARRLILGRNSVQPIARFAGTQPGATEDPDDVQRWYEQAYLMTRYLYYAHGKMQFKSFCDALRAGHETRQALDEVYGISNTKTFDKAWVAYAGLPSYLPTGRKESAAVAGLRPMEFPVNFSSSSAAQAPPRRTVDWDTDNTGPSQ